MARLVKAGTPRAMPPRREYTPEQLWLEAAAAGGGQKRQRGKAKPAKAADARSTRRADSSRACRDTVQGRTTRTHGRRGRGSHPGPESGSLAGVCRQVLPGAGPAPGVVHGGGVLLPVPFPQTTLHVLRAGVFVGSVQKGRFVPEHHLFTAFGAQCTNREQLTLADSPAPWNISRAGRWRPAPPPTAGAA